MSGPNPPLGCRQFRSTLQHNRREFLRAGVLGAGAAWGLSLPQLLRAEAPSAKDRLDTSVIILWMRGGPSHIDMWDMKPDAPAEYRGEFEPVSTKIPGIQLCEHLPKTAACLDQWSIIRSMHHRKEDGLADHSSGDQICFTGYPSARDPSGNISPSVGSIVKRQVQSLNTSMPAYVMVPKMVPGTDAAYLGAAYRPFETIADPGSDAAFDVPNLRSPEGISVERLGSRKALRTNVDRLRRQLDSSGMMAAMDEFDRQAWEMVTGDRARKAFDFSAEPTSVRERYGIFPTYRSTRVFAGGDAPNWGQRVLLARRLVEAGVRLVTVDCRWWDTHEDNFWSLKNEFLPRWDLAYSALIEDLKQRGLLERTLVVAWGEMGRMPRINTRAGAGMGGRDHWPNAMSVAIAGGGVQGGRVVGSTDSKGSVPKDNPKIPQDVLATIYRHLGVDTNQSYLDNSGRPLQVLPAGRPIDELF
ncbi:MAG: hypothetical protein JWN70_495 [Planctomycetaceae bacterium]|nr:hypothetical protein [Planctomycetaceae bacterium]